ncbi:hypothetical protein ESCO_003382 [Escovopsis weberi]|uniref:Uncharacterized protein n=1 Tax=Escovopsis weberi TaxID=150374 RepID=A0A0M8N4B7_ESCWE|nr:hypothetical protein ESCO_003382 [Escovopsis weberi]
MAELDPTAITPVAGEEPFTLEPFIKFMLSTRRCVPSSVFLVEGVEFLVISQPTEKRAVRLLLGDGELCIQAILHGNMIPLVEKAEIYVGCYVRVEDFLLRLEEPSEYDEDARGKDGLVYLIVNELQVVGWNETYVALWKRQQKGKGVARSVPPVDLPPTAKEGDLAQEVADMGDDAGRTSDLFEAYEALAFPSRGPTPKAKTRATRTTGFSMAATPAGTSQQPVALPQDWHSPEIPLKLTTLRSIPHLPYTQNWSVNVLAIVVSLSDVEPSYLPPGKQRTARIADPSTSKHVHLTVFLDPEAFTPKLGSAVLLTGVKNHRFDGGSLKKYASDGMKLNGRRWWFEDPREMKWLDVQGINAWWTEMENYKLQVDG